MGTFDPEQEDTVHVQRTYSTGRSKEYREALTDRLHRPPSIRYPWTMEAWSYLPAHSLHKAEEEQSQRSRSITAGVREPLDDENRSSSNPSVAAIYILTSPTRSTQLCCSGRANLSKATSLLPHDSWTHFTVHSHVDEAELAIDPILHCLDRGDTGGRGPSVGSHDGPVHLLLYCREVEGAARSPPSSL